MDCYKELTEKKIGIPGAFRSASGDFTDGILCYVPDFKFNEKSPTFDFYFYLITSTAYRKALIGVDFISCCKFLCDPGKDIIIEKFHGSRYRRRENFVMELLFKLSPKELDNICVKAEFDEEFQLIIEKENCVQEGNITFFKNPIKINYGALLAGVLDHTAIVKENENDSMLFLFAIAETEKYRDNLENFYNTNHCDQYDCFGVDCYCTGWEKYNCKYV